MDAVISKSDYMKMWREKKEAESPGYHDREREKARLRAREKYESLKNDPVYLASERERKRLGVAKRRATTEGKEAARLSRAKSYEKPENREKQLARTKKWRDDNPDQVAAYRNKWRESNVTHLVEYRAKYHAEYREREGVKYEIWKGNLWRNYKITDQDFNAMWAAQCGKCAICETDLSPRGRSPNSAAVDHNHETNAVRGILCQMCNRGIGALKDSPEILKSAAKYLIERGNYGGKLKTGVIK